MGCGSSATATTEKAPPATDVGTPEIKHRLSVASAGVVCDEPSPLKRSFRNLVIRTRASIKLKINAVEWQPEGMDPVSPALENRVVEWIKNTTTPMSSQTTEDVDVESVHTCYGGSDEDELDNSQCVVECLTPSGKRAPALRLSELDGQKALTQLSLAFKRIDLEESMLSTTRSSLVPVTPGNSPKQRRQRRLLSPEDDLLLAEYTSPATPTSPTSGQSPAKSVKTSPTATSADNDTPPITPKAL
eukprot:Sspe_Gene.33462::Locus_16337_Transcript_1_1_Confidence_1.000_Length_1012::g.33462::m.33462